MSVTPYSKMSDVDYDRDLFREAVMGLVKQTPQTQIHDPHVNYRRGFLVIATAVSGMTKYFFIGASDKMPGHEWWAACNVVGWAALEIGFAYVFIHNVTAPTTESEDRLFAHCQLSTAAKVGIAIPSMAIGAFSQLTASLQAVKYSPSSNKFAVVTITSISTGFYSAVSTQELTYDIIEAARKKLNPPSDFEQKLDVLRRKMLLMIKSNYEKYEKLEKHDKMTVVSRSNDTRLASADDDKYAKFMTLMLIPLDSSRFEVVEEPRPSKCANVFKKVINLGLLTISEYCGALYTLKYAKQSFDYDNDDFARTMSAIYAATSFYITWKINKFMINYLGAGAPKSTEEQLYPWTANALTCLTFIVDFFSNGSVWQIWEDFAQENGYQDSKYFYQISQCTLTFLILFASTLGTIRVGLGYYAEKRGSQMDQEILSLARKFQCMMKYVKNISYLHTCIALTKMPEALKDNLMNELLRTAHLTDVQLREYISHRRGPAELREVSVGGSSSAAAGAGPVAVASVEDDRKE